MTSDVSISLQGAFSRSKASWHTIENEAHGTAARRPVLIVIHYYVRSNRSRKFRRRQKLEGLREELDAIAKVFLIHSGVTEDNRGPRGQFQKPVRDPINADSDASSATICASTTRALGHSMRCAPEPSPVTSTR